MSPPVWDISFDICSKCGRKDSACSTGGCALCGGDVYGGPGLFWWIRETDETGMSGAGKVAQVAVFEDGTAVLRWLKARNSAGTSSTVFYDSLKYLVHVHGHGEKRTRRLEPIA